MKVNAYDALTLELSRIDALSRLIEKRLMDLSDLTDPFSDELSALSIVAESIREKTAIVVTHADKLLGKTKGGAR